MKQLIAIVLAAAAAACVIPTNQQVDYGAAVATTSAVYVNGEPLTIAQLARLEELIGEAVPAGRYVLDANGMFGYEGREERVDLAAYIRARQRQTQVAASGRTDEDLSHATSMYSQDAAGQGSTMVGYGKCVSMSTPTGTFLGSGC